MKLKQVILLLQILKCVYPYPYTNMNGLNHEGVVNVEIYYETLCPDSKHFILNQLLPMVEGTHHLVSVNFVPYGKAITKTDKEGKHMFTCQHGPRECLGNLVHACAQKHVTIQRTLIEYIGCMMFDNDDALKAGRECAKVYHIDWEDIYHCAVSKEGDLLLEENGIKTSKLHPPLEWVPTVLLNGKQDDPNEVLNNFLAKVCSKFEEMPDECMYINFYDDNNNIYFGSGIPTSEISKYAKAILPWLSED